MKKIFQIFIFSLVISSLFSCEPRIKMDMTQWGDHSLIDNVRIFTLNSQDQQLQEYFTNGMTTPARQRVYVSNGNAVIDAIASKATISVNATADITKVGIEFYHQGTRIEPLNGAPIAGILKDFSAKQFVYRVFSADGKVRDWTIIIK